MIAREQEIGFLERKGHVVCRVPRRRHRLDAPAVAGDHFAIDQRDVRPEIHIGAGVEPAGFADMERPRRAMRALGVNRRAGRRFDLRHGGRMIAVRMGDENMRDRFAAHRVEDRGDVRGVVRAGIEDRDLAAADDIADRALEGERPGIVGDDRAHAGRDLLRPAGHEVKDFVVLDVLAHAHGGWAIRISPCLNCDGDTSAAMRSWC